MASRRMFSTRIIESTRFLKMPPSSQNLYFHLGLHADDDGIVEAYAIMKMLGATEDDLRILAGKQFVTVLNEDFVTYLNDWREHNNIRADRKIDSIYKELLLKIVPEAYIKESKQTYYSKQKEIYDTNDSRVTDICQSNDSQVTDICQSNDSQVTDICQHRLGKDSIGKDSIVKDSIVKDSSFCSEPDKSALNPSGIELILNDNSIYDVSMEMIETWRKAYPAVNIEHELYKMRAWLQSNPSKRKTSKWYSVKSWYKLN